MNKHQDVEIPKILPQKKDQIKLKTKQKDSEPICYRYLNNRF